MATHELLYMCTLDSIPVELWRRSPSRASKNQDLPGKREKITIHSIAQSIVPIILSHYVLLVKLGF